MSIKLPNVIRAYFAADKTRDAEALSDCFMTGAVVVDEGNTYTGREAIRQWMANASTKYSYTVEPFMVSDHGGNVVVTSRLVGTFPGSPVDLRYVFALSGDRIAALEIVP
jgi:ketosteroid isomerase-like protein